MIAIADVWLPQMVRFAKLVSDPAILQRAWLHSDRSLTSATSYDELFEQIFDDADAEQMLIAAKDAAIDPRLVDKVEAFIQAMLRVDARWNGCSEALILASEEWSSVVRTAADLAREA